MKSFQVFSFTLLACGLTLACSNSNRNNIPGRQCPAGHSPLNYAGKLAQKSWQKGENESAIPVGTYVYQGADFIFTEKGNESDRPAIVHIKDSADKTGFKASVFCVRNGIKFSEKNLSAVSGMATKMISAAGTAVDVEAKEISFRVAEGRLIAETKALAKPSSLEKIYDAKAADFFIFNTAKNNVDFEVLSTFTDNNGSYVLSARFRRTDTPPAPAPTTAPAK